MSTLTSPIPIGDQQYNARLTVPQITELERKLDCPAGAILGRLLTGWGLPGHGVWSVPMGSRLGPVPRLARRGIRAYRSAAARRSS